MRRRMGRCWRNISTARPTPRPRNSAPISSCRSRLEMQPMPPDVQTAFQAFPPEVRHRLAEVRAMILDVAVDDPRIGTVTETLKWGEPAYLTKATGSGSTIRLGW